jgi:hypothetical protein
MAAIATVNGRIGSLRANAQDKLPATTMGKVASPWKSSTASVQAMRMKAEIKSRAPTIVLNAPRFHGTDSCRLADVTAGTDPYRTFDRPRSSSHPAF